MLAGLDLESVSGRWEGTWVFSDGWAGTRRHLYQVKGIRVFALSPCRMSKERARLLHSVWAGRDLEQVCGEEDLWMYFYIISFLHQTLAGKQDVGQEARRHRNASSGFRSWDKVREEHTS